MTDKELLARYDGNFSYLCLGPDEELGLDDLVSSFVFTLEEAKRVITLRRSELTGKPLPSMSG